MGRTPLLLLIASLMAGCASKPHVIVGSKNFTEQVVLGEIIAQQIERRLGIEVERKFDLGGTLLAHEALRGGSIDLYPEYTGTALTAVLKQPIVRDAKTAFATVSQSYRQWGIEWLPAARFQRQLRHGGALRNCPRAGLKSLSDAARHGQPWRLGVGYEFTQRPDGLDGLVKAYGLRLDGNPVAMDLGLLYPALRSQKIEMAAANATDGMLAHSEFTVLQDDLDYFPSYECAVAVRGETLQRFPPLKGALSELSGSISDDSMRRMNELVDVEHKPVAEVARDFLSQHK